jgi:hypothetical protein
MLKEAEKYGEAAAASDGVDGVYQRVDALFALLYERADALHRLGESARALAVFIELDANAAGYRDVSTRVARLSRDQAGGEGA